MSMRSRANRGAPPAEVAPTPVNPIDERALTSLALRVGSFAASTMNMPEAFSEVCRALPAVVGAAGAAIFVATVPEPDVLASDPRTAWLGTVQQRAGAGPVKFVLRSGQPVVTPDLTRVGPPDLAATAAESGFFTSVVVPLTAGGRPLGSLQVLGDLGRPVGPELVGLLRPLSDALAARLLDFLVLTDLTRGADRQQHHEQESPPTAPVPVLEPEPEPDDRSDSSDTVNWFSPSPTQPDHAASADGSPH